MLYDQVPPALIILSSHLYITKKCGVVHPDSLWGFKSEMCYTHSSHFTFIMMALCSHHVSLLIEIIHYNN